MKKVLEIKAVPYGSLPCEAQEFVINGVKGDKSDFGHNGDVGSFDYEYDDWAEENWSCADNQFTPHNEPPEGVLEKYKITEEQYREVQEHCATTFSVGGCGWCV